MMPTDEKKEQCDELNRLSLILNVSYEKGWITAKEKKHVENGSTLIEKKVKMYELLKTVKDNENAIRLIIAIRCSEDYYDNHNSMENQLDAEEECRLLILTRIKEQGFEDPNCDGAIEATIENRPNALDLEPVISNLMRFLKVSDLKSVRLVSWKWNDISIGVLRCRSNARIIFQKYSDEDPEVKNSPAEFMKTFSSDIPFTNYEFQRGENGEEWLISELNEIFNHLRDDIRVLKLDNGMLLLNENEQLVKEWDITPWIKDLPLTKPNKSFISKLIIDHGSWSATGKNKFSIPLELIVNVKEVFLRNCNLHVNKDPITKLCPLKLDMIDATFSQGSQILLNVLINDIIDFSLAKEVNIENEPVVTVTEINFDASDELILEKLELYCVTLNNWAQCKWNIKHLMISRGDYLEKSMDVKIQDFYLRCDRIDLWAVPDSVVKLCLGSDDLKRLEVFSSQPIILNRLQHLIVEVVEDSDPSIIALFANCQLLVNLEVNAPKQPYPHPIKFIWIPKTVKKLQLCKTLIEWEETDGRLVLDQLNLMEYNFQNATRVCVTDHLFASEVVLSCSQPDFFLEFMRFYRYQNQENFNCYRKLYLGVFYWRNIQFKNSVYANNALEERSLYYLFEGKNTKGIAASDKLFRAKSEL